MKHLILSRALAGLLCCLVSSVVLARSGWISLDSGTTRNLNAVHFVDLDRGYAVGASGLGLVTVDAGATWQTMPMNVTVDLHDVYFLGESGIAVGNGGTILRSTDAGASWTPVPSGVFDDILSVTLSGTHGICGARSQTILYTTDGGASWLISQSGFFGGGFYGTAMVSPDIGFVGGENSIFQPLAGRSMDGGATWSFSAFYLNGNEGTVTGIDFTDMNIGYATSRVWDGRGAISRTGNGGQSWTTTIFPSPLNGISFPISDASLVGYAVGTLGTILKTGNAGSSWQAQDSGTFATLRGTHFVDLDNGFAVGDGGTILKTTTGGEPSVPVHDDPLGTAPGITPVRVTPSPFARATEFRFQVPAECIVSLTMFDVAGRKVRTLLDGQPLSGSIVVSWDGADDSGRARRSGVYVFRLEIGSSITSGRVLLVR